MKKLVLLLISVFILASSAQAQFDMESFAKEMAAEQPSLTLEVLIFSDGSAFLRGQSDIDPGLPISYKEGKISGLTNKLTSKQQEVWKFSLQTQETFDSFNARFVLPKNAKLVTGSISSDSLPFIYTQQDSLVLEVSDSQKPLSMEFSYEVPLQQDQEFPVYIIYLIAIIVALAIVFWVLSKQRKQQIKPAKPAAKKKPVTRETTLTKYRRRFKKVRHMLNARETKIIEGLLELGGKAKSNQLQKYAKIPKAAFSRHIATLEAKDLITKKSLGRANLIQIKVEEK